MLSAEENDLLCRVENGAPMGKLMRQHWVPACLSEEVAENDGTPVRIRALGDNLVAFRDTKGRLGVLMKIVYQMKADGSDIAFDPYRGKANLRRPADQ